MLKVMGALLEKFEGKFLLQRAFFYIVSLVFLYAGALTSSIAAQDESPLDSLVNWQFEEKGAYPLMQRWKVSRDEIVSVENLNDSSCNALWHKAKNIPQPVTLPDVWGPTLTTDLTTGHGKATYCLDLVLPSGDPFYAVRMGSVRSASAIYAVFQNEHNATVVSLLHQNGDPGATLRQKIQNPMPPLLTLPHGVRKIALIAHVQNDIHKQGGLIETPVLDLRWRLQAVDNRATALPSALVIVLFTISIASVVVGLRYERAQGHNIFAFLAFASAVRVLFVSDIVWDYFPSFPLGRKYDLEYLSFFLIAPAYYAFIGYLFRGDKILKVDYVVYGISAALIFFTIFIAPFFPPGTVTLIREAMQLLWAIIGVVIARTLYRSVFSNPQQHQEVLVVITAAFSILIYESLAALGVITSSQEWAQGLLLFVMLMHTKAFVSNTRRIEQERDALTARLQEANDILEKRAISLDLALMRAEEASKSKSEFLATISHELRTPLNAIIGFSELMDRGVFGPLGSSHYTGYAKDINDSGLHLLSLVDDILDLSRIEAGTDELKEAPLDLGPLAGQVVTLFKLQASNQNISFDLVVEKNLPLLMAEERKIRQVLINLLNNAVKFNVVGGEVNLRVWGDEQGVYVDVADTGIGIAEEEIPNVLRRFGQVDRDLNRKYAGVGIGLPLSLALMQQHGGDLTIKSKLNSGTTVTLHFPLKKICN